MKKLLLITVMAFALLFTGCAQDVSISSEPSSTADSQPAQDPSSESAPTTDSTALTDRAGNEIEVKDEYTKIVSYAPSVTQVLIDLGYGDKIVAITSVDTNEGVPEDVLVFDMMNADIEAITALEPDLIITTELTNAGQSDPFAQVRDAGATVAVIPTAASIEGIYEDIHFLGELLNLQGEATAITDEMKSVIAEYETKAAEITDKKTVYFEISAAPYMYGTGTGTYLSEMIEIIGGTNSFSDQEGWFAPTDEMVLANNPDVIFTNVNYIENSTDEIMARNGWDVVSAITNGDVYYIENLHSSIPNHSIIEGIKEMALLLYPEVYGE